MTNDTTDNALTQKTNNKTNTQKRDHCQPKGCFLHEKWGLLESVLESSSNAHRLSKSRVDKKLGLAEQD
jgi:hypothetical protein